MRKEEFEKEYRKNLEEIVLPQILKDKVQCTACLKERRDICTLLVYDKRNNREYVLKIAESSRGETIEREKEFLDELYKQGIRAFPQPLLLVKEGRYTYYLRDYVEGDTLLSAVKKHGCMPEIVLLQTAVKLCRILDILGSQCPPVVHRDIKPENIVYTKNHEFMLIDFETARKYVRGKDHDTVMMGSRPTAAPEQFGCAQTDCRTDIYGLGMTLLYLACGSYDRKDLRGSGIPRGLRRIILKAVAFDPKDRYQNSEQLRRALTTYGIHQRQIRRKQRSLLKKTGVKRHS